LTIKKHPVTFLGNFKMRNILVLIILSISTNCIGQTPINDGNKNFNHYNFSDSIQFYWPNGNPQYKFINIYTEERFGGVSGFTNELFYSHQTGKLINGNKFFLKYGISTLVDLRDKAHKYFLSKETEIKEKNRAILQNKFYQGKNLNYSVLDILKTLLLDSTNIDTIKIKHGLLLNLGKVYFYSKISRTENNLFFQNYTEELNYNKVSQDSSILVQNLILDSECKVPIEVVFNSINVEKEKCWLTESKIDYRWTFQFNTNELKNEEIKDFFGFHLYYFLNEIVCQ
jgi:hypothetical protein